MSVFEQNMKSFLAQIFILLGLFQSAVYAGSNDILIIESYEHSAYIWDKSYLEGIKSAMGPKFNYTEFEMDTKRKPVDQHAIMADKAWQKYQEIKPALVFLGDDAAVKFLGPRFGNTQTPVVFLGVNNGLRNYFDKRPLPLNISGVLERPMLKKSLVYLNQLDSNIKKIAVLFDSDLTAQIIKEELFGSHDTIRLPWGENKEVEVDVQLIRDFETWKTTVLSLNKGYQAAIIGLYQTLVDKKGAHIDPEDVIVWTSQNSPVPPFAFWDFAVGKNKAIGGLVLNGKLQGKQAGAMALQRLQDPAKISQQVFVGEQGSFVFSKTQMKKWNISLPDNLASEATLVE